MKTIEVKLPTIDEVTFTLECLPEDIPVRGNYMDSGDEAYGKDCEDKILEDMEWNEWAWCSVHVTASWRGLEGKDWLGCCSYDDEEAFKRGGYWDSMRKSAYADLIRKIESLA